MPNHKTKKPTERAKSSNTLKTPTKSSKSTSVSNSSYTPKSSLPSKTLKLIKKHKIISALLLILLIWLTYTQTMNYLEKRKFLSQYSQLEDYANQISKTHPPTNKTSEKSCRYQSAKLGHGDLYCWVSVTLEYENYSADKANQTTEEMKSIFGDNALRNSLSRLKDQTYFSSDSSDYYLWQAFNVNNTNCAIVYVYPADLEYSNKVNIARYTVRMSCNTVARAEHFPVKKP